MATFPVLKTGAVAQYPLERTIRFKTQTVKFLDGSQQSYRLYKKSLRRWLVSLNSLDEQELSAVIAFVEQQGSAAFSFADPVTGESAAKCVIGGDSFDSGLTSEMKGHATLSIEEIL